MASSDQRARGDRRDGPWSSAVVERDATLAALDAAFDDAVAGRGNLTFLAGEAGIGKTTVVTAFTRRHTAGSTVLVGACDNLTTPQPLGPLLDMATTRPPVQALLDRPSRHELFVGFLELLSTPGRPAVVVLEDVHWADTATLDLLRFLGRRVHDSHAVVLASYRPVDVEATHPLRQVLGDLATQQAVTRHTLSPLSPQAVAQLAEGAVVDPVRLHALTGGNPFFVTEVLAHPEAALPDSVRDAVLGRHARLGPASQAVLEMACLVPGPVEADLVAAVVEVGSDAVDACVVAGMLRSVGRQRLSFRHELARQVIADTVPPARRADLHGAIARALLERSAGSSARIAHHAHAAGDADLVLEHAPAAAADATGSGAHQQAHDHLQLALPHADQLADGPRADLLERYAEAAARVARWTAGRDAAEQVVALRRELGDPLALGRALRLLAIAHYESGDSPAAYRAIDDALATLEPHGPTPELCDALATAGTLAMLARSYRVATERSARAAELAESMQRPAPLAKALNSIGAVELLTGDVDAGVAHLLRSIEVARGAHLDHQVCVGLLNIGSGAGEVRRYDLAGPYLEEAIDFATARDLDDHVLYATAWSARVHLETGAWAAAEQTLAALPQDGDVSPITRITALAVRGRLRSRCGDAGARQSLDEAWAAAAATEDLQRIWPVAAARGEHALREDRDDDVRGLVAPAFAQACDAGHPWAIGELGILLWRSGALDAEGTSRVASAAAGPYRLEVTGDVDAAAAAWADLGCPYERADVLRQGDEDQQLAALAILDDLGAVPDAARLRRQLRARGIRSIPRGPRPATAEHPHGLTPREAEVLELVAEGLTNAEIGEELFISAKTAGNHVSSILAKLGVSSRHEAAAMVG